MVVNQYNYLENQMNDYIKNQTPFKVEYSSIIDISFLTEILSTNEYNKKNKLIIEKVPLAEAAQNLLLKKFDCCISFDSEFVNEAEIDYLPLHSGKYVAVVGKNHPLYNYQSIDLEELYDSPIVMLSKNVIGKSFDLMIKHSEKDGFTPKIVKVVDDIETELFEIETNNLLGFFPDNYPLHLSKSKLAYLSINNSQHQYQIVLAYLKNNNHPLLTEIIQNLKES